MIFQPFQTVGYSLVSLLALEEVIIVPSGGFPTQIAHLGGQFSEAIYQISQSQDDDGTGRDYAGDDCWIGHVLSSS